MIAIRYLAYADSVEASDGAKDLIAEAHVSIGVIAEKEAAQTRSCQLARMALTNWNEARAIFHAYPHLPWEGSGIDFVIKTTPTVERQVTEFCHERAHTPPDRTGPP